MANRPGDRSKAELAARLKALKTPPPGASPRWYQNRGRALEGIINGVLDAEGLAPNSSFRPDGEEIDGSFVLNDRVYLLEAKWREKPTPASDLYAFKGKIDGKLVGTIGVFITMNRFSDDAVPALMAGKALNMVLFSAADFEWIVEGGESFRDALIRKLRYAAERGFPYLPLRPEPAEAADAESPAGVSGVREDVLDYIKGMPNPKTTWNIVVQNRPDKEGLAALLGNDHRVAFWVAEAQDNVPAVAQVLSAVNTHVVAFIDGSASLDLRNELAALNIETIVMDPNLEWWLREATETNTYNSIVINTSSLEKELRRLGSVADIALIRSRNPAFDALLKRIWPSQN